MILSGAISYLAFILSCALNEPLEFRMKFNLKESLMLLLKESHRRNLSCITYTLGTKAKPQCRLWKLKQIARALQPIMLLEHRKNTSIFVTCIIPNAELCLSYLYFWHTHFNFVANLLHSIFRFFTFAIEILILNFYIWYSWFMPVVISEWVLIFYSPFRILGCKILNLCNFFY